MQALRVRAVMDRAGIIDKVIHEQRQEDLREELKRKII